MTATRQPIEQAELATAVRAALGGGRRIVALTRLTGGTKKGVYRMTLDDSSQAVLYVWSDAESDWPARDGGDDRTDPFADATGADLFEASHAELTTLDVRVPRLYLLDRSRERHPYDFAIVEDVPGEPVLALLERGDERADPIVRRLGEAVAAMHLHRADQLGKVLMVRDGAAPQDRSCPEVVRDAALRDLAAAAARVPRLAQAQDRLADLVRQLVDAVAPRSGYGLIHSELGPEHVLVGQRGEPVIVDIEGLMYFDIEWEHVFLRRFGEHYRWLRLDGLDEHRLRCYDLAWSLSLVAGPLRLLDRSPEHGWAREIAEYHTERVLAWH